MDAAFNFSNKKVYGNQMMDVVRKYKLMPDDIFSKKGEWQMMARSLKHCFTTSEGRFGFQLQLSQYTQLSVATV